MKGMFVAVAGFVFGSIICAVVADMCKEEVRTRLDRLPLWLLDVAALCIPRTVRSDLTDEWRTELDFILHDTDGLPVTRLLRGVRYSVDLLLGGAAAVAREIAAPENAAGFGSALAPAYVANTTWSSLFPNGRDIFYEGDDPAGFVRQIEAEFGFSPARDPHWSEEFTDCDLSFTSYMFHCPPEHLDAIYGSDRFPMGS